MLAPTPTNTICIIKVYVDNTVNKGGAWKKVVAVANYVLNCRFIDQQLRAQKLRILFAAKSFQRLQQLLELLQRLLEAAATAGSDDRLPARPAI